MTHRLIAKTPITLVSCLFALIALSPAALGTVGKIREFPLGTSPNGIAAGSDGNLWLTEPYAVSIGRITTSGSLTEFRVPGGAPQRIAAGPDGHMWFTVGYGNKIGRISTSGVITERHPHPRRCPPWHRCRP